MTTTVQIVLTHLHEGCVAEVHYANVATGEKLGMAARLQAPGESATVACHSGATLVVSEVKVEAAAG